MKYLKILAVLYLLIVQNVFAGDIYATITKDNVPFANQQIKITDAEGKEIKIIQGKIILHPSYAAKIIETADILQYK